MTTQGQYGVSAFGGSTFGGRAAESFRVLSAEPLNSHLVVVEFNQSVDFGFTNVLNPSNYTIPGITVSKVLPYSAVSVILTTQEQSYQSYVLTVGSAQALGGGSLDLDHKTASFTGVGRNDGFTAVGLSARRLRLLFSEPLAAIPELENPASYAVQRPDGSYLTVEAVRLEQTYNVRSVVLHLGSDLTTTFWYQVRLNPVIRTETGLHIVPSSRTFQYLDAPKSLDLDLGRFSGEVRGGLFGQPDGMVFFSPALDAPLAGSVIEIDSVEVCTVAYDKYEPPTFLDPAVLYTWGSAATQTTLGSGVVLWAPAPRLAEARFGFQQTLLDSYSGASTSHGQAVLQETWDPSYVSLLDNPYWTLTGFPSTGVGFQTAQNLAPIPPGLTTTVTLEA